MLTSYKTLFFKKSSFFLSTQKFLNSLYSITAPFVYFTGNLFFSNFLHKYYLYIYVFNFNFKLRLIFSLVNKMRRYSFLNTQLYAWLSFTNSLIFNGSLAYRNLYSSNYFKSIDFPKKKVNSLFIKNIMLSPIYLSFFFKIHKGFRLSKNFNLWLVSLFYLNTNLIK